MGRGARRTAAAILAVGVGTLGLPVAVAPVLLAGTGCAGDDCDADVQSWGSCAEGERISATQWESGPMFGEPWLNDHGERTWVFDPTPWMGTAVPSQVDVELAFDPYPFADASGGAAAAAGNLGEWTLVQTATGYKVQVLNDSCAQYYVRVVISYETDGGTSASMCAADGG